MKRKEGFCYPILAMEQCEVIVTLLKGIMKANEERIKSYPLRLKSPFVLYEHVLRENKAILEITKSLYKAMGYK